LKTRRIVITGAPGTGKTSVINALEENGFFCYAEIIRSMTSEAKEVGDPNSFISNPLLFVNDPMAFNTKLLEGRIAQFKATENALQEFAFYDRAAPDVLAYMDFFKQPYGDDFKSVCQAHRYDKIFILPPWKAIYVSDAERMESYEEAIAIHEYLLKTYTYFGYTPILVPKGNVAERVAFILKQLNAVL